MRFLPQRLTKKLRQDFGVFTDTDGKGYIVYNAYDHRGQGQHSNSVDLLTEDFTASTGQTSGFFVRTQPGSSVVSLCPGSCADDRWYRRSGRAAKIEATRRR